MNQDNDHIFLNQPPKTEKYTSLSSGGSDKSRPERNRQDHYQKLKNRWQAIWDETKKLEASRKAASMATAEGTYIEFEGLAGFEILTKSLEAQRSGITLRNVTRDTSSGANGQYIDRATIFVPTDKQSLFLNKLESYVTEVNKISNNPKHQNLIESIEEIRIAVLESMWRDDNSLLPTDTIPQWCEIWLSSAEAKAEDRFRKDAKAASIKLLEHSLQFPERRVTLGFANRKQLLELLNANPDIAEFRKAKQATQFLMEQENAEKAAWVEELRERLVISLTQDIAVCILDTGINNGHPLIEPLLSDEDCHTFHPEWGTHDHEGHGTQMSGLVIFGDLEAALEQSNPILIGHCLESAKILPPNGNNDPDLYGEITKQVISKAEIGAPQRIRIGCMAVTTADQLDKGRPSSWSAAIDQLTSGYDDKTQRLFLISAGNLDDQVQWQQYPESNLKASVQDPGQSWNALTVGAYTERSGITDLDYRDYVPLALPGELSPYSTTSTEWQKTWPIKPDIVLEGGNIAKDPSGLCTRADDLSLLTLNHNVRESYFETTHATSAATAQASWMAAQIQVRYPKAWPETIRGLLVHSAEWPEALKRQFSDTSLAKKTRIKRLLSICGYGVPNLAKALACKTNTLTLISESYIQPFTRKKEKSTYTYSMNEMHLYELPWPKDILLSMEEAPVKLRITLSYFIEPGPGEVGYHNKYRYASHGLRFDLNIPTENAHAFHKRLNKNARAEDEVFQSPENSDRWTIGKKGRDKGSIHSDTWHGTAAELATCNLVGVYPVMGWWRTRHHLNRWNSKARYSLIVSLETAKIDIYTKIANRVKIAAKTEITP